MKKIDSPPVIKSPVVIRLFTICLATIFLTTTKTGYAEISIKDDLNNVVILEKPAKNIISLAPHTTEMLFSAGAGPLIKGVVKYSNYPPEAKQIPVIGSYNALDLEKILAMQPDLVLAWHTGNRAHELEKLKSLGLNVYITDPRDLEDVASNIERLGLLTGTHDKAKKSADAFRQKHRQLKQLYSNQRAITVFYQIWNKPLMTVNGEHLISRVIRLCGGVNVFSDLGPLAPAIDIEAVIKANPQVIIASGMDEERPEWLDDWRRWQSLSAVKNDNLYFIPPDIMQRHTSRILQGAEQMCSALETARKKITTVEIQQ